VRRRASSKPAAIPLLRRGIYVDGADRLHIIGDGLWDNEYSTSGVCVDSIQLVAAGLRKLPTAPDDNRVTRIRQDSSGRRFLLTEYMGGGDYRVSDPLLARFPSSASGGLLYADSVIDKAFLKLCVPSSFRDSESGYAFTGLGLSPSGEILLGLDILDSNSEDKGDGAIVLGPKLSFKDLIWSDWSVNGPAGTDVDDAGRRYMANRYHSNVKAFDGIAVAAKTGENDDPGNSGSKMMEPIALRVKAGKLYVLDAATRRINIYAALD
jgi:hypothetical protein